MKTTFLFPTLALENNNALLTPDGARLVWYNDAILNVTGVRMPLFYIFAVLANTLPFFRTQAADRSTDIGAPSVQTLEKKIAGQLSSSKKFLNQIKEAYPKSEKVRLVVQANLFLRNNHNAISDDLKMCKAAGGCAALSFEPLLSLSTLIENESEAREFQFLAGDGNAELAREEFEALLSASGIQLTNRIVPEKTMKAKCKHTAAPKKAGTEFREVELRCELQGRVDNQVVFEEVYVSSAIDKNVSDALTTARSRLKKESAR